MSFPAHFFLDMAGMVQRPEEYFTALADYLRSHLPASFIESLPPTVQGHTPDQYQYWIEPPVAPVRPDSPKYIMSGALVDADLYIANHMAPRFLNGVAFVVEEVLPGEELIPGNVYRVQYSGDAGAPYAGGGHTFRLLGLEASKLREGGQRMLIQSDADPAMDGVADSWMLNFGKPEFHLYRFLHYHSFAGLVLPTQAFPVRAWAEILARREAFHAKMERQKARRRELYAQKKARKQGMPAPAISFVPRAVPATSHPARRQAA